MCTLKAPPAWWVGPSTTSYWLDWPIVKSMKTCPQTWVHTRLEDSFMYRHTVDSQILNFQIQVWHSTEKIWHSTEKMWHFFGIFKILSHAPSWRTPHIKATNTGINHEFLAQSSFRIKATPAMLIVAIKRPTSTRRSVDIYLSLAMQVLLQVFFNQRSSML